MIIAALIPASPLGAMMILSHESSENGFPAPSTTMFGRNLMISSVLVMTQAWSERKCAPLYLEFTVMPSTTINASNLAPLSRTAASSPSHSILYRPQAFLARNEQWIAIL